MPGLGDLAPLFYAHIILLILNISPIKDYIPDFEKYLEWVKFEIWPGMYTGIQFMKDHNAGWGDFITDTVVAAFFLASAVFLMSRKDIGYTSD